MAAIQLVADRGSVQNNTSETATALDLPTAGAIAVGNYLVLRVAADNSGTSGAARTLTITDPRSNTWTVKTPANRTAGTASDGATAWIAYAKVTNAYTDGDDLTLNWSGAVVAKAANVEELSGVHPSSPEAVGSTTSTGSSTTPSISRTPTEVGQMFYGALGIEGLAADTYTQDTDAVDGTWKTLTSITGGDLVTAAASITIRGARKITGVAAQTWNPTITSRDWAQIALVLANQWPAGVRGAHSVSTDASVGTIDTIIAQATQNGDRGVAFVTYNPATQDCPTPSTGGVPWTVVGTQNISASARTRVYKKSLTAAEAGAAITFTNTTTQRLQAGVIVFDGSIVGDVDVFASAAESSSTATHTAPTTGTMTATGIKLSIFSERSSAPSTAIVSTPSGTTLQAFSFGAGSGSCGGAFAVNMTPVASGSTMGGSTWVASDPNSGCSMWTLAVVRVATTVSVGAASETDAGAAITPGRTYQVGRASVTNTAATITRAASTAAVARATETDTAATVARSKALGVSRAVETSTGTGVTPRKLKAVQGALEAATAGAISRLKTKAVGRATSTETAGAVARRKLRTVGQAAETDTAAAIVRPGQVARATEVSTAGAVAKRKTRAVGQVIETSTAGAIAKRKLRAVGQAISTETAAAFAKAKVKVLGATAETDTARPVAKLKTRAVGRAVENGVARGVATPGVTIVVVKVVETSTATSITVRRIISRPTGAVIPYPGGGVIPRPSGTLIPRP